MISILLVVPFTSGIGSGDKSLIHLIVPFSLGSFLFISRIKYLSPKNIPKRNPERKDNIVIKNNTRTKSIVISPKYGEAVAPPVKLMYWCKDD